MSSKARGLADLGNAFDDGALSNRNMVINGAMQVAQRGTSVTGVTSAFYTTVDRFVLNTTSGATWTATQESDAPSGFSKSFKHEVTSANASPAAGYYAVIQHRLEGQNVQSIAKGTADAKSLTVSFWVKSNVTGTYRFALVDVDNTRTIGATYSVSSSGAWEYKTITFDPDTTGVLDADDSESLSLEWWISSGTDWSSGATPTSWEATVTADRNAGSSVNVAGAVSNYFQITGVQLEVGDTATPFEHPRSYSDELARCKRYYEQINHYSDYTYVGSNAVGVSSTFAYCPLLYSEKRAAPSITGNGNFVLYDGSDKTVSGVTFQHITPRVASFRLQSTGLLLGRSYKAQFHNAGTRTIQIDAEL